MKHDSAWERVWELVREIPRGKVMTYGQIAILLEPLSARAVGWAMNNCHTRTDYVPAHRVVNRIGLLTGKHHFGFSGTMQELLENEGAIIENDRILNFKELFWDPSVELEQNSNAHAG